MIKSKTWAKIICPEKTGVVIVTLSEFATDIPNKLKYENKIMPVSKNSEMPGLKSFGCIFGKCTGIDTTLIKPLLQTPLHSRGHHFWKVQHQRWQWLSLQHQLGKHLDQLLPSQECLLSHRQCRRLLLLLSLDFKCSKLCLRDFKSISSTVSCALCIRVFRSW